jgi:hypothetical protein
LALDSLQDDENSGLLDFESGDEDQESVNVTPKFEVHDDGIIEYMHTINIMAFFLRGSSGLTVIINKQTGQIVPLRNKVCGPIEPTGPQLESWAVSDNGASEAFNMFEE